MIDLVAYIAACKVPYSDSEHNCFDTAAAAFPHSAAVADLRAWWNAQPRDTRAKLSRGELQLDLDDMARRFGLSRAHAPTGRELGVIKQLDIAPPIFCVGAPGAWFLRMQGKALKLPEHRGHLVARAWSVV